MLTKRFINKYQWFVKIPSAKTKDLSLLLVLYDLLVESVVATFVNFSFEGQIIDGMKAHMFFIVVSSFFLPIFWKPLVFGQLHLNSSNIFVLLCLLPGCLEYCE